MTSLSHRSPGITAIFNAVKGSKKNGILDLGAGIGSNLSFYSQLGCHFHFENFDQAVIEFLDGSLSEAQLLDSFLEYLPKNKTYDVVLFWDLLNYLPHSVVLGLVDKLRPIIKSNALVHMLNLVGSSIPARPGRFSIGDKYMLSMSSVNERAKPLHRMTTVTLLKTFSQFLMVRSFLNGQGMLPGLSEQLLRFGAEGQEKGSVFSSGERLDSVSRIDSRLYSPSIQSLISEQEQSESLLDLGSRKSMNHDFWRMGYARVVSSELLPVLNRYYRYAKEERGEYLNEGHFLHLEKVAKFDFMVAWDLFNYCDNALLIEVGKRLTAHASDGAKLVVLVYSGEDMPASPQSFLVDKCGLGLAKAYSATKIRKNVRKLTSSQVQKAFPGFYVEQTFAFRPGMQKGMREYVFVFKGEARLQREKADLIAEVMARREKRAAETALKTDPVSLPTK